jgi:hypothetical protein
VAAVKLFRRRRTAKPQELGAHLQRVYWKTLREQQRPEPPRRRKAA